MAVLLVNGVAVSCNRATRSESAQPPAVSTATAARPELPSPVSPRATPDPVPRVTTARLQEQLSRDEIVVIDVRDIDSYVASHIAGAMHIPLSYIESELPYLPRNKPIVTYCT